MKWPWIRYGMEIQWNKRSPDYLQQEEGCHLRKRLNLESKSTFSTCAEYKLQVGVKGS
jgi:hypothetical protein